MEISPIAHLIQLPVAPVFLRTVIAVLFLRAFLHFDAPVHTLKKVLILVLALSATAAAQPKLTLPKGVVRVSFGTAHRYFGPGKEMCVVVYPLPSAVFQRGITELTYAVELEPKMVKRAAAQVIGSSPDQLRSVPCNVFTPIPGGFSQTQIGSTISRVDKGPLAPGQYMLRITVDGQSADVPFSIK